MGKIQSMANEAGGVLHRRGFELASGLDVGRVLEVGITFILEKPRVSYPPFRDGE